MKKLLFTTAIPAIFLLFSSCKSADKSENEIEKVASDYCDCFKGMEANLSAETKTIIKKAVNSDNPTMSAINDLNKLDKETDKKVEEEMKSFSIVDDPNSEIGRCIKKVERKYKNEYNTADEETARKVISELEKKSGCDITLYLLKGFLKIRSTPGGN